MSSLLPTLCTSPAPPRPSTSASRPLAAASRSSRAIWVSACWNATLAIQLIGGQPADLYVRAGHPLAGRDHPLQEVWAYGLAVPTLLSPSKLEIAALLGLPEGQAATIALECDNYGMLKTVALTTDTVLGATNAAVR